jgi:hypothetical protein
MKSLPRTALLPVLVLAGCASAPLSSIKGEPFTRTDRLLGSVRVVAVGGQIHFKRADEPIQLEPGLHELTLESAPPQGAGRAIQQRVRFMVEPCMRYYLAARRDGPMSSDWTLVIDHKERAAGCDPQDEIRKAASR